MGEIHSPSRGGRGVGEGAGPAAWQASVARAGDRGMKAMFYRSLWLPALVTAVLLLLALTMLVGLSWRDLRRLAPMRTHLALIKQVQDSELQLQRLVLHSAEGGRPPSPATLRRLRARLAAVVAEGAHLIPETPGRLRQIEGMLEDSRHATEAGLATTLDALRQVLSTETLAHDALLARIERDTEIEFRITAALVVIFPALALLVIFLLRHRILLPLTNLRFLMSRLALQDYRPMPAAGVDPMLMPLFRNYNHLVDRLARLERAHQARQWSLEQEVRAATRALLEQQRNLAAAERLAAVGEVAAGLAHELRNPLAGIQMALGNLRRETTDAEHAGRLDLVIAELKRVTRLANDLLSQAQQAPEPAREVAIGELVGELLALARYQVPAGVRLESSVPDEIRCRLPEGRLRQVLLNLVLNGAQAVGEGPGRVVVEVEWAGDMVRLAVWDEGPGFPDELLAGGVAPFVTRREQGTGLGLAMVRRFAKDLGGELLLANREPHGACAAVILPCLEQTHA